MAKSYGLASEALDSHKELCSGLGCRLVGRVLASTRDTPGSLPSAAQSQVWWCVLTSQSLGV